MLTMGCSNTQLTPEKAKQIIEDSGKFPRLLSVQLYFNDVEDGRKAIDSGLVDAGVVTVDRSRKNESKAVILFTDKAQPFLLAADKGQLRSVQKVKVADEVLDGVDDIKLDSEGKQALVYYRTKYANITPFAKMQRKDLSKNEAYQVRMILRSEGWEIQP